MSVFLSCTRSGKETTITGTTMGTTYSVKIRFAESPDISARLIKQKIDSLLSAFNLQVSTYIPASEISKFNSGPPGEWFHISDDFSHVVEYGLNVYEISGGAFDITVNRLVRLWGFGKDGNIWEPPPESEINRALNATGSQYLTLSENRIKKDMAGLEIDLSAIAKGYGVDLVACLLSSIGLKDYMVEIGGEVRCHRENSVRPWKIGIEFPDDQKSSSRGFAGIVNLNNLSMATSGNYRNYFMYNGRRYSHTINPKTGRPVEHNLSSTTIIASDCMSADALATAVMVLGADEGIKLIESLEGVESFLIEENDDGTTTSFISSGFGKFME